VSVVGGSRGRAKNKKRKGVDWYLIKNAEAWIKYSEEQTLIKLHIGVIVRVEKVKFLSTTSIHMCCLCHSRIFECTGRRQLFFFTCCCWGSFCGLLV
jgi:hypothetical protein